MTGSAITGKKAAITTKERYGEDAFKKWGADGNKLIKNPNPGFAQPKVAAKAGRKGGKLGHRCRKINKEDNLRDDEWAVLLKITNRVAGLLRLSKRIDAMRQHQIYHSFFDYWERRDWVGSVTKICEEPTYYDLLVKEITKEFDYYTKRVSGQPRRSPDREHLRIVRNIKAAVESLGEENNAST